MRVGVAVANSGQAEAVGQLTYEHNTLPLSLPSDTLVSP